MSEHDLKAALRRCHTLLQDAGHWIDMDAHADWHAAMDAELLACDEAGECPTVAATAAAARILNRIVREEAKRKGKR